MLEGGMLFLRLLQHVLKSLTLMSLRVLNREQDEREAQPYTTASSSVLELWDRDLQGSLPWPTGRHWLSRAAGESCRTLRGGLAQQVPILLSSAMERGSDRKSLRHWSEQAERKMLWGEQNLSPLWKGTLWQPESGRKADWHHGLLLGVALGMTPGASQGRPHTPHIPCATQSTHCLQDRALEEWYELHADPPYHLPQGNQYILTSNSHIPGGCYGWGGGGRTESKQQQQEQSWAISIIHMPDGFFSCPFFFFIFATKIKKKRGEGGEHWCLGSDGRKTYFPQNKVQKREGKAPAYPSLWEETTGSANFHSWGNSQMTDLLFYMHSAREGESAPKK